MIRHHHEGIHFHGIIAIKVAPDGSNHGARRRKAHLAVHNLTEEGETVLDAQCDEVSPSLRIIILAQTSATPGRI
jgi:hypothetical protein